MLLHECQVRTWLLVTWLLLSASNFWNTNSASNVVEPFEQKQISNLISIPFPSPNVPFPPFLPISPFSLFLPVLFPIVRTPSRFLNRVNVKAQTDSDVLDAFCSTDWSMYRVHRLSLNVISDLNKNEDHMHSRHCAESQKIANGLKSNTRLDAKT